MFPVKGFATKIFTASWTFGAAAALALGLIGLAMAYGPRHPTMLGILGFLALITGIAVFPWALGPSYREVIRDRVWLMKLLGLCILLAVPSIFGILPHPLNLVSFLVLLAYSLPLLRVESRVRMAAFVWLGVGMVNFLLPVCIFLVEKCRPSGDIWIAIVQTNVPEALEYLQSHHFWTSALLLLVPIPVVLACSKNLGRIKPRRHTIALFCGVLFADISTGVPLALRDSQQEFGYILDARQSMKELRSQGTAGASFTASAGPEPRKILLVIGESTTRRHMGIYGYPLPTTPCLQALKDQGALFVFDDVVSPNCSTMASLQEVLTQSNIDHPVPFTRSIGVLDVFKKAGYQTWWMSNQNRAGVSDDQVSILAEAAEHYRFATHKMGFRMDAQPDEDLLPLVEKALPHDKNSHLFVCHLMGAHGDYRMRVSSGFKASVEAQGIHLGAYDLAIRYGDAILSRLITQAESAHFDMVVYLSDHGEDADGRGHDCGRYIPIMVEIPLLIWFSPEFRETHPKMEEAVKRALHRPFQSDNLFHTLIDLAGIRSSLYDPTRSLINNAYIIRKRRVVYGRIPYPGTPAIRAAEAVGFH